MTKALKLICFFLFACSAAFSQTVISSVYVSASTGTTATIVWTTSTASTSTIRYGTNLALAYSNNTDATLVTSHSMTLTNLNASQPWYFAVVSTDNSGIPTQSSSMEFALCGQPTVPVTGTVNFAYGNGGYTLTWNPPAGAVGSPTVCGQPVTQTVTGTLNTSGSFSAVVADALKVTPGPGTWTVAVNGSGNIGAISVQSQISTVNQDVSIPLQNAASSVGLTPVTATASTCNPSWVCAGSGSVVTGQANGKIPLATGSTQITAQSHLDDGLTTPNVITSSETTYAPSVTGNAVGGTYYAGQYPGQSNNGIALTFADATRCGVSGSGGVGGCTVIAGPTYPTTEQPYSYNFFGMQKFPSASNTFFHDQRLGWNLRLSHDPTKNSFDQNGVSSFSDACIFSHINGWSGFSGWQTQIMGCHNLNFAYATPGLNMGTTNGNSGSGRPGGWTVSQGLAIQGITNTPGITEALSVNDVKAGVGDQTIYFNHWSYNGAVAGSDEGTHILSLGGGEAQDTYIGLVATGGIGATTLKITCQADCAYPGDGRYDIDLTKGLAGNVTGIAGPSGGAPGSFVVDLTVTPSTAWGTTSTNIATPTALPLGVGSTPMTFTVNSGPGNTGQFANGDLICFQSDYHEQTKITNVTGTGPWTITAPLRHAHNPGWIMANGPCGQFIDFAANDGGGVHTLHYPVDILGATDAHTLKYNFFTVQGASTLFPTSNIILPSTQTGTWSNTGGIVTIPNASPWGAANPFYGQSSITIAGVSDSTFNGTCTSVTLGPASLNYPIQCTQASSTGHTVSGSGTISVGTNGFGNTAITLYPGAELLDMQDYDATACATAGLTAPCNDGTHTLEPNTVAWTAGDSVENSHHYAAQIGLTRAYYNNYNGWSNAAGRLDMYTGLKSGSLGNLTDSYQAYQIQNNTPWANHYSYHGGGRNPPGGFLLGGATNGEGVWNWGLAMTYAPDPVNSSALWIGCPASGCTDPNYYYFVFSNQYNGGTISQPAGLRFTPSTARYQLIGAMDSLTMINPAVVSTAAGIAASATYTSTDSGSVAHKWTITAPLTGGGFTETWPQSSGTIINSSNVLIASGASHAAGLAPDPGSTAGTTRYLREDATWQTPPTSAPYLQGTTQVIGGTSNAISMGDYTNLVPWSTDLVHSGAWNLGGFVGPVGGQTDPWGGTTATQLTSNGSPQNYQSTTTTTNGATYCVSSWMKGNAGGEQVGLYIGGAVSSNFSLTTSWVRYSASITTAGTQGAGWHQFGSTVTFFVAGLQVNLGACSAAIPAYTPTAASAITTPIPAVQTPTLLNGSSTITVPNTTGTMALTSQLTPVRAGTWSISAATSVAVTFSPAFTVTPTSCAITPTANPTSVGAIWMTTLTTSGMTVNVNTSGTIAGTYQCVVNNSN